MNQANATLFWLSAGLPEHRWPEFITWLNNAAPGIVGNLNLSGHWLREFSFSLFRTVLTNIIDEQDRNRFARPEPPLKAPGKAPGKAAAAKSAGRR